MKMQKSLALLATVSLLGLSVACSDRYEEGISVGKAQGYDEGYDDGYLDGDDAGYARAEVYFASATYQNGFNDGKASGLATGYTNGYAVGKTDGVAIGYNSGYSAGYDDGYDDGILDGYDMGYDDGLADGYDMGYDDGMLDGYDMGYDDGLADGYDIGYDDGFDDGYGFSVGATKSLKGYANILSMAHNDMFDYSKIAAPKATARGLVANGKLLFEETSLTNKDTLKRAAVVEQYLVVEMAKQVKSKFGLSAERSLQVAKASNHFRKNAANGLSSEDTSAYVSEIIGTDLKSIEAAHAAGDMKSVLEVAAKKNGTTVEKMAEMIAKNFI